MGEQQQTKVIHLEDGWDANIVPKALVPLEGLLDDGLKTTKIRLYSQQEKMSVYTMCYDMCTQKQPFNHSDRLYELQGQRMADYLTRSVLPALRGKQGEQLLQEFVLRGDNHQVMNKWYTTFFMYLDRFYVKYNQLPTLKESGVRKFKAIVFDAVKGEVTAAVLKLINDEREGFSIDRHLIRRCINLYQEMGADEYRTAFQTPFIAATREYYDRQASSWIVADSTPSYLKRVEKIMEEESARVSHYLQPGTEKELLRALDDELLQKRLTLLLEREGSGCRAMLANNLLDDLARLFRLFHRLPDCLGPIAQHFQQHILDVGKEKIDQRLARLEAMERGGGGGGSASAAASSSSAKEDKDSAAPKEGNDDPQFIKDLLNIHDQFSSMVQIQFQGHALFQKSLKAAFSELVNQDSGRYKTADLISTFCDRLLKSGGSEKLSDAELESFLERAVQLFTYLSDKDVFADIYRNQLARRLLQQRSASDDMERLLISKLKLACGAQFTAKMEGMLNDLAICTEQSTAFEAFCRENPQKTGLGKLEFSVQVLTAGHWPQYKSLHEINLPPLMHRCTQLFKEYYDAKTSHRRLQWTHSLGSVVIKGTFAQKRVFDLQVTTIQAVVLMAFNADSLGGATGGPVSFNTLLENLNMGDEVLKKALHSLSCGKFKILVKASGAGGEAAADPKKEDKIIRTTDVFSFNEAFTCPMRKIRVPMASLEDNQNLKRVEEDRTHAIEAAAVRIMKARKTLSHQQLVAEVLSQLAFFRPDAKLVKRRIEALIEREFLERDPENPNVYRYLA